MKKTFKTTILSLTILLIASLITIKEIRAEEIKKEQQAVKPETSNQKIKYTKEQTVLKKIEELNKRDSKLTYNYLTKEEQLIRLEMMKKKKEYSMKWYEEMFPDIDCTGGVYSSSDMGCTQQKLLSKISQDQTISILINYDDYFNKHSDDEFNPAKALDPFIISIIVFGTEDYLDFNHDASGKYLESYLQNGLKGNEIDQMIQNKIILNNFKKYRRSSVDGSVEKLNKFFNN